MDTTKFYLETIIGNSDFIKIKAIFFMIKFVTLLSIKSWNIMYFLILQELFVVLIMSAIFAKMLI